MTDTLTYVPFIAAYSYTVILIVLDSTSKAGASTPGILTIPALPSCLSTVLGPAITSILSFSLLPFSFKSIDASNSTYHPDTSSFVTSTMVCEV